MTRPVSFIAGLDYEAMAAEAVAESLLGAGYDAVEWTMAHLPELRGPSSALACRQDPAGGGEPAGKRTLKAIEAAADAGIAVVDVLAPSSESDPQGGDDDGAWSAALSSLEVACVRAEQLGVKIGFEPSWGTLAHDAATAQRVLDAVPVSVTFDPSHFVLSGDDIPALVGRWGERIVNVHLKDAFGRPGVDGEDFHFCLLGEGRVPWAELLAALDEVGYRGALAVEFEAYRYYEQILGGDPAAAARLARSQVEALLSPQARGRAEGDQRGG